MIGSASFNLWTRVAVFHTLPPLPSLTFGDPSSDPAQDMLSAVRAAGGCLEFPGRYEGRWVVLRPGGGVLRFPSPVGHRLVSRGLICRHPGDVPGHDKAFVRFIPKERMPRGFEFKLVEAGRRLKAEARQQEVEERIKDREEFLSKKDKERKRIRDACRRLRARRKMEADGLLVSSTL